MKHSSVTNSLKKVNCLFIIDFIYNNSIKLLLVKIFHTDKLEYRFILVPEVKYTFRIYLRVALLTYS